MRGSGGGLLDIGLAAGTRQRGDHREAAVAVALTLTLALAIAVLYGRAVRLWWLGDDLALLRLASDHRLTDVLLSPAFWRSLPGGVFTPLQVVSLEADLALWGMRPVFYYLHHLVALWAAAAAIFFLYRFWLTGAAAFAVALLFLLGVPTAAVAQQVMVRHYLEGLVFAAAAATVFVGGLRRRSRPLLLLAAACYLGAMAYKEIYVALPLLLLLLPEQSLTARWRASAPLWLALVFYLAWRWAMLGTLYGGYGFVLRPAELPAAVPLLSRVAAREVWGSGWLAWPLGLLTAAVVLRLALSHRRGAGLALAGLALAVLPVLPLVVAPAPRYFLLLWLALAGACVAALARRAEGVATPRPLVALAVLGLVLLTVQNRRAWNEVHGRLQRVAREGKSFLAMGAGELLRQPLAEPHYLGGVRWLRERRLGRGPAGGWFYDDLFLWSPEAAGRRVWGYPAPGKGLTDLTRDLPRLKRRHRQSVRWQAPLEVELRVEPPWFSWRFGPGREGEYAFVEGEGVGVFPVPAAGRWRLRRRGRQAIRVRYEADGWRTYSPLLVVDFGRAGGVRWRRGSGGRSAVAEAAR